MIEDINEANAANFVEELDIEVKAEIVTFTDGLNSPSVYIRRIIKFCKSIAAFRRLDREDQLLVVKPYFTEMLLARFSFAYSLKEDAFPVIAVS